MPARSRLAVAALCVLAASAARAADPWDGPAFSSDPKALLAAASALAPPRGEPVDLLLDEATYRYDARGALTVTQRRIWRALAPDAARAWQRVERGWSPWHQARPEVRARVVTPDGEAHTLDPATLSEQGVRDEDGLLYSDRRVLAGPLPAVRTGSVVELVSVTRDEAPAFDAGTSSQAALAYPVPVRLLRVTVESPAALPVKVVVRGVALAPRERSEGGVRRAVLERRDVPAAEPIEPAAPPDAAFSPHAAFGWGRSWKEVAERYGAAWERQLAGADLAAQARAALGDARPGDRAEAVRRIAAWVHRNVRYTGLELGQAAIVPATPAEVLARRYGDCKDLSLLVVALLRAAGHDARLALVRSSWDELAPELPGISQFDHVIVRVEGTPAIWLDATDSYGAPGRLPPPVEGRLALVTGPGQKELVRTPESGAPENRARFVRELRLAEMGRGAIVETRELTGALAAQERALRARIPPDRQADFDAGFAHAVFGADELVSATAEGLDDPSAPVRLRHEAREAAAAFTDADEASASAAPDQVFEPVPRPVLFPGEHGAPPPVRKADLVLPFAYQWEIVYRVVPPAGFRPRPPPAGRTERFGPATFTSAWSTEADGTVVATFRFDSGARRLAAADARALAERARAILADAGPRAAFERVAAALLAGGQVPEALAELRRLAALHPAEAVHPIQLALALLDLGYADAALAEARRAVALEPGLGWAHRVLGWIREHDAVGRLHGPGWDRAGALAAYRRARELDPDHAGGRAMLASVLATAPDGTLHGAGAQLDEAIAEYAQIPPGEGPHAQPRLEALLAAGRDAEAERLARELPRSPARDAVLLAAVAVQRGAAAAEAEARALGEGRREALREGAKLLVRGRRYEHAHALVDAAARGAPNAAEIRQQAEAFDGLRRWEALRTEGTDAERLVRSILATARLATDPGKELAPLLASELSPPLAEILVRGMEASFGAARRSVRQQNIPTDVALDLVLSKLEVTEDGDPRTGLRLRVRGPFAPEADVLFAVREGKGLRLAASDASWPLLGHLALRRAAAGDLAAARRLLDWAREVVPGGENDPAAPGGIFARLWRPGATPSRAEIELAAASLAAWAEPSGPAVKLLAAAHARSGDAGERRALAYALAHAHRAAKRHEDALALGRALLADEPSSRDAFAVAALALAELKRRAELDRLAEDLLARLPDDGEVLALYGSLLLQEGDLEGAARAYRRAIGGGRAPPGLYNNAAWLELFRSPGKDALEWARRAAASERGQDHATQNTVAAVFAEVGRPAEAREVFLRSLDAGGSDALRPADWYVFGRIAEAWGILDAARAAYARVEAEPEDPTAPRLLAQRRLAALPPPPPEVVPAVAPETPGAAPPAPKGEEKPGKTEPAKEKKERRGKRSRTAPA